jgi:hypothetical protein
MTPKFLDKGTPIISATTIARNNSMIRLVNPDQFSSSQLMAGTLGRVHSEKNGIYTVWLLDDRTMNTVIIEAPLHLMGQYFRQHPHGIFAHLR